MANKILLNGRSPIAITAEKELAMKMGAIADAVN